jgi:aconitate hydratase 2/2-methylisocitrate dehydratase
MADMVVLTAASDKVYQYLNFDKVQDYTDAAATVADTAAA